MARLNLSRDTKHRTHGDAQAFRRLKPIQQLRRSVLSCLLWEDEFYEDGKSIAERITEVAALVKPEELASLAVEARKEMNLRHTPLLLLDVLSKTGPELMADTTARVISRADEMGELLSIYWRNGRKTVPRQMRKGLAKALTKFDEYQLAKYDRDGAVKLRDVLRIVRPKPDNDEQSALWKRVKDRTLETPDTWEVALSGGADKRTTFERLIREGDLGYLALLRNLRNIAQADVDAGLVKGAIVARRNGAQRVLPFRYIAAARAAPMFEPALDQAFLASLEEMPHLDGKTVIVVDVSGSMYQKMSRKSDLTRADAACALAAIARGLFYNVRIFATAGNDGSRIHKTKEVPARHGMALVDAIHGMCSPLGGGGIFLKQVMDYLRKEVGEVDRLIVVTDEQDCGIGHGDSPLAAVPIAPKAYMVNVASAKNGIGYGENWTHLDGFSENVFRFIYEVERDGQGPN